MAPPRGDYDEQGEYLSRNAVVFLMIREVCFMPVVADRRAGKGTEVFVGGLPRSATESTLREVGLVLLFQGCSSPPPADRRLVMC
jgi:hypothetical protein